MRGLRLIKQSEHFQLMLNEKCLSTAKNVKTIKDYINRNYLKELSDPDKLYFTKLIMLHLEYNRPCFIDNILSKEDINPIDKSNKDINPIDKSNKDMNFSRESTDKTTELVDPLYIEILEAGQKVYSELGWGWAESCYREALSIELTNLGYICSQEVSIPIKYGGIELSHVNSRIDILARKEERDIILELKADAASKISMEKAVGQCKRYMKLMNTNSGLVLNFPDKNVDTIESSIC